MQNLCWFTSSRSQNCHNIYIFIVSCVSALDVSLYFNIGNYHLPSQRKHKVLEGKDSKIVSVGFSAEQKYRMS